MDEKKAELEELTQKLLKIAQEQDGNLSEKDEKEIREMAENWLFLIDDVPKE